MKKKILFMLTVVCVLMILTSVGCRRVPYDEDLQILGSYIPGFATGDTRVSSVRIIETDSFGRRLFCFQSNISAFENDQVAYAIVQKTEKKRLVFFKSFLL